MNFSPAAQLKILKATLIIEYTSNGSMLYKKDGNRSTAPLGRAFWQGFDNLESKLIPKGTMIYAAYKAGCACRKLQ